MTLQELKAMNLALEALMYASYEDIEYNDACAAKVLEARNALKEALAQPEQEPLIGCVNHDCAKCKERIWVGLTDKDLDYLCHLAYSGDEEFALAVQAKLKEKNT
jgi:hypothetical protein